MDTYGFGLLQTYPDAWKVFLGIFLLTNILTGVFYVLAKRQKLLPAIRARDVHTVRKPRVGGVAMWIAALVGIVVLAASHPAWLNFGDTSLNTLSPILSGILAGMSVVLLFGLLDDLIG